MKHFWSILILLLVGHSFVNAQQVGIVLSGGGAKGVAHIGVLQALEDNGIPIDCITGTSIGAIVGGLYAMGYSPSDMMDLIKSKDFDLWKSGTVDNKYQNFFRKPEPTPEVLSTSIPLKETLIDPRKLLPSSLLNPIQLNLVFMQLTAQATAFSKGNFDRLFVPFRSVAANIQERKAHIFRDGDLGDAMRASMTFPFVFKAIRVNNALLYDGGIFDNYPVDVMKQDFKPEKMLGSIVDKVFDTPADDDMYNQLQRMIMHPTSDSITSGTGLQLKFDLSNVSLLAFDKADSIYKIGYDGAMAQMDSIKKLITRRVDPFSLELKRSLFKSRLPYLRFHQIEVNGVSELQREYIFKILKQDGASYFSLEEFREGYFRLLTGSKTIKEIIPHAVYDEVDRSYKLILDVEIDNSIDVAVGLNLSSSISNQLYLGLSYEALNQLSQVYQGQLYMGRFHTGLTLSSQFNMVNRKIPQRMTLQFSALNFNYFQGAKLFYQSNLPAFMTQYESFLKLKYAIPFHKDGKLELALGGGFLMDSYMQEKPKVYSADSYDRSMYSLGSLSLRMERNTLNNMQYPTEGFRSFALAQYLSGSESYRYPDSVGNLAKTDKPLAYIQGKVGYEFYMPLKPNWILGFKGEGLYNDKRSLDNYTSSIIQAPAFAPTPHSKTVFNEAYRANQYLAIGMLPILKIRPSLQWRTEIYGFFPLKSLHEGVNHEIITTRLLSDAQYLAESSLVYNLNFASLSVYLNHYSAPSKNWNFGLNLGFLLFTSRYQE